MMVTTGANGHQNGETNAADLFERKIPHARLNLPSATVDKYRHLESLARYPRRLATGGECRYWLDQVPSSVGVSRSDRYNHGIDLRLLVGLEPVRNKHD